MGMCKAELPDHPDKQICKPKILYKLQSQLTVVHIYDIVTSYNYVIAGEWSTCKCTCSEMVTSTWHL